MAGRILNRRELRKQADSAEQTEGAAAEAGVPKSPAKKKARAKSAASPAKKARPKKEAARMRARWGVFDGCMKRVAIFDFNQRAAAEEKLADLLTKKKLPHFLQLVKEPIEAELAGVL